MNLEANYVVKHDKLVRLLGMKIESASPEFARVSMPILEHHRNGMGAVHGGAIFSLADAAFGAAANSGRSSAVVSLCSSIEFLRAALKGPLAAEARAVRLGGHIASYDVQVFDGDGLLVARVMCEGYVTDLPLPE